MRRFHLVVAIFVLFSSLGAPLAHAHKVKIVALGDSLTSGYGLPRDQGFVPQLQAALNEARIDVEIVNAGVSGDTTSGGLARLDWSVPQGTEAVILELGANDALRAIDPGAARKNLDEILTRLKARKIPVLLAGMLAPPNLGPAYGDEFNAIYPELADKHGALFYPFFLEGVAGDPALNQADGIHPTAEGVDVIVAGILPKVIDLIEEIHNNW